MGTVEEFKEKYKELPISELDSIIAGLLFSKTRDESPLLIALIELVEEKLSLEE